MFDLSRITVAAAAANTVEDTFIDVINQQGIQPPSDSEAISVAHDACAVIDRGGDLAAAVDASIASYCPEHESLIG